MASAVLERFRIPAVVSRNYGMVLPLFVLITFLVILMPLPTALMDILLIANLAMSGVVLLTVMYMPGPLEFSSFPSLLLGITLFRLVLNIATTRLVLTKGDAGHVVTTFGSFVAGGSLVVGIIIFIIIVVIQFVVITKGATRIAEVAARFTLDGMPGKQMAIDADLNAGMITADEAKRRRADVTREADFYGAMDGASKFVRGDAIAGILITVINILGGIYVGIFELQLPVMETLRRFTILTIGDGLVSQIPAFIVSLAAATIVTRSASRKNLGEEVLNQLVSQPLALAMTGGFLMVLALTPLPKIPLISLAVATATGGYLLTRKREAAVRAEHAKAKTPAPEKVEKFLSADTMGLDVGFGLIALVDRKQGGDLLDRITNLRKQMAQELGIIVPPIRIRDDVQLQPNQYRIKLKGMDVAQGEVLAGHLLAIDMGLVSVPVPGLETKEPAFGLPAVWINPEQRHEAEHRHYTVVEASSVISTHLTELIKRHSDELLTRQEVNRLLDHLKERSPKLVDEVIPDVVKPGELQRVLQSLLRERVPIRDLEAIVEAVGDVASRTKDIEILTEYARHAVARSLCLQHRSEDGCIHCITLDPSLEELVTKGLERTDRGTFMSLPPPVQSRVVASIKKQVEQASATTRGRSPVLLCPPAIRAWVRRMIEVTLPSTAVLSYNEVVRGVEVHSHGMVVLTDES